MQAHVYPCICTAGVDGVDRYAIMTTVKSIIKAPEIHEPLLALIYGEGGVHILYDRPSHFQSERLD